MPRDYYTNMLSLRADILIATKILYMRDKKLMKHLEEVGMDVSLIMVESFITLFTTTCHADLVDIIIDHFVIDGAVVLLKTMVLIMSYFAPKLMVLRSFSEMLVFFKKEMRTLFVEPKKLSSDLMNLYLSKYLVGQLRDFYTEKERKDFFRDKPMHQVGANKCKASWPICYQALEAHKAVPDTTKSKLFKCNFIMDNYIIDYFSRRRGVNHGLERDFEGSPLRHPDKRHLIPADDLLIDRQRHECPMRNAQCEKMKSDVRNLIAIQISNSEKQTNIDSPAKSTVLHGPESSSTSTVKQLIERTMNSRDAEENEEDSSASESQENSPCMGDKGDLFSRHSYLVSPTTEKQYKEPKVSRYPRIYKK